MILAVVDSADKHYSSYHRVFSVARGSLDRVGLVIVDLVSPRIDGDVLLALDDTLARKRGLKMFGMHHDPLLSSRGKAVMNWGHSWVVLGAIVELPFRPGHFYCLPILFRLYLNKTKAVRRRRGYRPLDCPWYTSKAEPSFTDLLAPLRRLSIRQKVLTLALRGPRSRKVQPLLENAYANPA